MALGHTFVRAVLTYFESHLAFATYFGYNIASTDFKSCINLCHICMLLISSPSISQTTHACFKTPPSTDITANVQNDLQADSLSDWLIKCDPLPDSFCRLQSLGPSQKFLTTFYCQALVIVCQRNHLQITFRSYNNHCIWF